MNDVGRKILLNLAKRRRLAYRDYLSVRKTFYNNIRKGWDLNLMNNTHIQLAVWVESRNAYFEAKAIYEKDSRSG